MMSKLNTVTNRLSKQAGMSLIEAVAGLAILGTVGAGALMMNNMAQTAATGNRVINDLSATKLAIQKKAVNMGRAFDKMDNDGADAKSVMAQLSTAKSLPDAFASCTSNDCTYPSGDKISYTGAAAKFTLSYITDDQGLCEKVLEQSNPLGPINTPSCAGTGPYTLAMDFK